MKAVEEEKLEWISDLPRPPDKPQRGGQAQARFDFSGRLVARDAQAPVREGLYHHGEEQEVRNVCSPFSSPSNLNQHLNILNDNNTVCARW